MKKKTELHDVLVVLPHGGPNLRETKEKRRTERETESERERERGSLNKLNK